jgi:hypothetical protein
MLSPQISGFLKEFRPGTHAVLFYDSLGTKHDFLFSYLKFGVEDQGLVYVCSEETPSKIREEMKKFGLDSDELTRRNRLMIRNYDAVYLVGRQVSIPDIVGSFSRLARTYTSVGLSGLRAVAEMSCFFKHRMVDELLKYEYALNRTFDFPAEGICGYNILEASQSGHLSTLIQLARSHSTVIIAGPKENIILEPEDFADEQLGVALGARAPLSTERTRIYP